MNGKKYEIILSVLTILTVIVTATGVSFAYFTTSMTGTPGNITTNTATIGSIVFDGGADFETPSDIEPGWKKSKTITLTAAPSVVSQTVKVKLRYKNEFRDMTAKINVDGTDKDIILVGEDEINTHEVELFTKTFEASDETQTATYTFTMEFIYKDEKQNYDQGKIFDGELFAELNSELYYTNAHPEGTTEKPLAE